MALTSVTETKSNLEVEVRKLRQVTVLSGQTLEKGYVVTQTGQYTAGTATAGTNTGNGTVSGETASDFAVPGTYTLTCTVKDTDAGTFSVTDPNGVSLPDATVAVAYDGAIGFTIADGGTDFEVNDSFTIVVTEGAGKVKRFATTNEPFTVMAEDVDASAGDVVGWAYQDADLLASEVDFNDGTDAEVRYALNDKNIFLMD
jgi:hypothetical protein